MSSPGTTAAEVWRVKNVEIMCGMVVVPPRRCVNRSEHAHLGPAFSATSRVTPSINVSPPSRPVDDPNRDCFAGDSGAEPSSTDR
jgi:hypothetical protein